MLKKSKDFVGLTLTDDYLKVAHIKGTKSVPKVANIGLHDIKGLPQQGLISAVKKALKGVNVKKANLLLVVPPSGVSTKNIEIPSTNSEEIRSIVNLQAGRHTPFSREEIQVGYVNMGVSQGNFTKVLLVIADKKVVKEKLAIFEKAGVKITDVCFASEGVAKLYGGDAGVSGVIDIDASSTEFVIVKNGITISSRNIPIGRSQLESEGASAQEKLVAELTKTIESYQSEDIDAAPQAYYIAGDDQQAQALQQALSQAAGWTVNVSSYADRVKLSGGNLKKIATTYAAASFLDVIATASNASFNEVSLMPEEVIYQASMANQGREVLKAAMLSFILLVLIAGTYGAKIYFKGSFLSQIKKDYSESKAEVMMLEEKSARTRILRDFFETRMATLDTLSELYDSIPEEVYLTNIKLEETGDVSIQGISDVASIVFNLGTSLKESDLFKNVEIKSTSARKDRGKDVSAFEITLKLKSALTASAQDEEE